MMIKIETSKIEKWEEIKNDHSKYCENAIKYDKEDFLECKSETTNFLESIKKFRNKIAICPFNAPGETWFDEITKFYEDTLNDIPIDKTSTFKSNLKQVFDYSKFANNRVKEGWTRHKLLSQMGIDTCCYCNRQYITHYTIDDTYKNKSHKTFKTTADLDHFYPQDQYPFLSLSLYNFIPSCQICNSRFKLAETLDIVYPYDEGFGDDVFFELSSKDGDLDYLYTQNDIKIKLNTDASKIKDKVEKSIDLFRLNKIYESHEDYATEIIKKVKMYASDGGIEDLFTKYGSMFSSKDDFIRTIFGNYFLQDDLCKRPLSKLTRDILKKHGLENLLENKK